MGMRRLLGLGVAWLVLASCAAPRPKHPLVGGYYMLDESKLGVIRRIVIVNGARRASYDVWRVSDGGDGTARHAHYDLIASDEVPSSGNFAATQDGTDCGTFSIEPLQWRGGVFDEILTVRYGLLGVEHFAMRPAGDAARYREYDEAIERRAAQLAADKPRLYGSLSLLGKFFYSELTPRCTYD